MQVNNEWLNIALDVVTNIGIFLGVAQSVFYATIGRWDMASTFIGFSVLLAVFLVG